MNERNYYDLKKHILEGKVVPFVGAGVSMAVLSQKDKKRIFPTWIGLLNILADGLEKCGRKKEATVIKATLELEETDYLRLADDIKKFYPTPAEYNKNFEEIFNINKSDIDDSSLDLARAIWGLGQKLIITTNYDKIMCWASDALGDTERWNIESAMEQASSIQDGVKKQTVWHLHGHISEKSSIILTTDSYDELYKSNKFETAFETLKFNLASKTFLFIGYSLDDEYLVNELEKISNIFKGQSATHYVLIKEGTKLPEKFKNKIIPIYYENYGSPLIEKLKELSPPPKPLEEMDEVKKILREKLPTSKELKEKLFEYLNPDESEYRSIRDEEDYSYLLQKSLEQKDCLYCIFKDLGIDNDYLDIFHNSCKKAKQKVKKLVLRIEKERGEIDSCFVEGWVIFDANMAISFDKGLENIDFSRDKYLDPLSKYLTENLKFKNFDLPLNTELILDNGLFAIDCRSLKIDGSSEVLNATIRLLSRDKDFFEDNYRISAWRTNSRVYRDNLQKLIQDIIQSIDESTKRHHIRFCFSRHKILVVSKYNLFDIKYLERVNTFGLPIIFSPCSNTPIDIDFGWNKKNLSILRETATDALDEYYYDREESPIQDKLVQFVYDDYFEVEKFKEMINDTKEYLA